MDNQTWFRFLIKAFARCLAALFLGVFLSCSQAFARVDGLVIDYPDYWPFFTRKDTGEMTGFFHDIIVEALARMGVETQWRKYPWSRCQDNVKHGDADAMITVPTSERLRYTVTHSEPFYRKKLHVFTYNGHPKEHIIRSLKTFDDIKAADLTVITYAGNGWNDENIVSRGIKMFETPVIKSVWRMLAARRGDIVIEWPMAAWAEIRKTNVEPDAIVQTDVTFGCMPFHLLINKRAPQAAILPEFNQIVLDMRSSGRIGEIVEKYTHGN